MSIETWLKMSGVALLTVKLMSLALGKVGDTIHMLSAVQLIGLVHNRCTCCWCLGYLQSMRYYGVVLNLFVRDYERSKICRCCRCNPCTCCGHHSNFCSVHVYSDQ